MKFIKSCLLVVSSSLLVAACGGDNDDTSYSNVSFSVSDAPVEGLSAVVIAFDQLEFIHADGERTFHDIDGYEQINLLDYPGTQSALIISDIALRTGEYKNLIIHIKPEQALNYVIKIAAPGVEEDLKQPSNELKLGGFTVIDEAVQAFTIEFDLRKSLVMRGNNVNNKGYILKPHGVTIVDTDKAASLSGNVEASLLEAEDCDAATGNFVYLYQGQGLLIDSLADNFDIEFIDPLPDPSLTAPYASTSVDLVTGDYAFGYLPSGYYTVAFSCSAVGDDPVKFDGLIIPDPAEQFKELILPDSQELIFDFKQAI
ncbi:DUF4382 domain-containing protein [Moritella sp. Urea-trap-13]|uniref:DUF4382 domain-containing protein n=1 Tax=Moritella sp. Urea-trap-13 TaxID=2058327 RepID=UPI001E35059F|nr:DUF4382 domain-containing protein [Moritella sp. Urea-trap-13]